MTSSLTLRIASLLSFLSLSVISAQPTDFLPGGVTYDSRVPSPQDFLGSPIGRHHTRHGVLVNYLRRLAQTSDRARFQITGYTSERRPLILLTLSTPSNLSQLEEIRTAHLRSLDPDGPSSQGPVVIYLGYGVHGNEASSAEAAMLTAYHFAAAQGESVEALLSHAIILVDPVYNPDGRDRHTNWVNMYAGRQDVADPADREHNEDWPSGRTNHYWFDLNRDWLPAVQVESQVRLRTFHRWMPHVTTDYHEMGTDSTYFFEPTHPHNQNPHVPAATYELTALFARDWARALDSIGSLYYTKERYDDFYPGYGSSYPDLQGGLGLLFEQARSGGRVKESRHGLLTFSFAIRNHLRTSLSTVETAVRLRSRLQDHQRLFFSQALTDPTDGVEGFVFGHPDDPGLNAAFIELLLRHGIRVHPLKDDLRVDDQEFKSGAAWLAPLRQAQRRMVLSIFETRTEFPDSLFYDTSAWSMAYAYGLPHASVKTGTFDRSLLESALTSPDLPTPPPPLRSNYAYAFEWSDSRAKAFLFHLQEKELVVKTAFRPFVASTASGNHSFRRGSMVLPVSLQPLSPDELFSLLSQAAREHSIRIYSLQGGLSEQGIDLGSPRLRKLDKPSAALLVGQGTSAYQAGQIWHLLDTEYGVPLSKVDLGSLRRFPLQRYNRFILTSGKYEALNPDSVKRIKTWTQDGGTLILLGEAIGWGIRQELIEETILQKEEDEKKDADKATEPLRYDYAEAESIEGAKLIGGAIFKADLDPTHPLGFGVGGRGLAIYRNSNLLLSPSANPYSTVVRYADSPLISGYVSENNLKRLAGSASVLVSKLGRGRVISFVDDPNFRGFWHGTSRIFGNALFLGDVIDVPRVREFEGDSLQGTQSHGARSRGGS